MSLAAKNIFSLLVYWGNYVSLFMSAITMVFGFLGFCKEMENDVKERFFNKVGFIYGMCGMIIWFFHAFFYVWIGLRNFSGSTPSIVEVGLSKVILTILYMAPVVLDVIFITEFIKIQKNILSKSW